MSLPHPPNARPASSASSAANPPAPATSAPRDVAIDSKGNAWVTDSGNRRVERFSAKGAYLSQFGAYGPNDGQFKLPQGLAISGSNIWVADTGNDRVQELSCL